VIKLALLFEHDYGYVNLSSGIPRWFCYHSIRRWREQTDDKRKLNDEPAIAPASERRLLHENRSPTEAPDTDTLLKLLEKM
jgi:hypothetical protein